MNPPIFADFFAFKREDGDCYRHLHTETVLVSILNQIKCYAVLFRVNLFALSQKVFAAELETLKADFCNEIFSSKAVEKAASDQRPITLLMTAISWANS